MSIQLADGASMSAFAADIMQQKYSHDLGGVPETWEQIADRVPEHVLAAVNADRSLIERVKQAKRKRKLMLGGRYLAATGLPLHQVQNCVLNRVHDSRKVGRTTSIRRQWHS